MIEAFAAAILLGGINTIADVVSTELKVGSSPVYILARVLIICYCVGGIVGARGRQMLMGSVGGVMIGAVVSATYYLLAPSLGWWAVAPAWSIFWLAFSLLDALVHGGTIAGAVIQALAAILLSAGFYFGITNLWPPERGSDPSIWRALASWSFTFLPGFIVLFWRKL